MDLEVDLPRNRLYATEALPQNGESRGVRIFDLETHAQVGHIFIEDAAGLAISPNGTELAVSAAGSLHIVDLSSSTVARRGDYMDGPFGALLWDIAYDGSQRLVASFDSPNGTWNPLLAVDPITLDEEWRNPAGPTDPLARLRIRVDPLSHRLYVLAGVTVFIYDLTQTPPPLLMERVDGGFAGGFELTADGQRLFFGSGKVYWASNLSLAVDTGGQGEVFLDEPHGYFYYAIQDYVDRVHLSNYSLDVRAAFREGISDGGLAPIRSLSVDGNRQVAYVTTPMAENANRLFAVDLTTNSAGGDAGDAGGKGVSPLTFALLAGVAVAASIFVGAYFKFLRKKT